MSLVLGEIKAILSLKNFLYVLSGTIVLAIGSSLFIIPYNLVSGGVTGVAIAVSHIFGFDNVDLLITVMSWSLFAVGIFVLGKGFAIKTLISSLLYPVLVSIFSTLARGDVLGGFFHLYSSEHSEIAIILASIFGGALIGTGCALTFLGGGSTGGTDIIVFSICKFFKRAKSSIVIFCVDIFVIALGVFALSDIVLSLLGIVAAFVSAITIDKIFLGETRAFMANIISDRADLINKEIIRSLCRTTTILDAQGGYTGQKKKMLIFTFTMREYARLLSIVNEIDPSAFIVTHRAHEINGKGWND